MKLPILRAEVCPMACEMLFDSYPNPSNFVTHSVQDRVTSLFNRKVMDNSVRWWASQIVAWPALELERRLSGKRLWYSMYVLWWWCVLSLIIVARGLYRYLLKYGWCRLGKESNECPIFARQELALFPTRGSPRGIVMECSTQSA
jgi:hypothetical protein